MLYGAGNLFFVTKDLNLTGDIRTNNLLYPPLLSTFNMNADVNFLEAKAMIDGKIRTVASIINEETYTVEVTTQFADWNALQFAYNELSQSSSGIVVPTMKTATIGAAVSGEIADPDITATTAPGVLAYITSLQAPNSREFLTTQTGIAAGAVGIVTADGTNGKLLFDASYDGFTVQYIVPKTYTSAATIGLQSTFDQWGKLEFWGRAYGTEFDEPIVVRFPRLERISIPSITISGDITELTVEFRASVDVDNGFRSPYVFYKDLVV